MLRNPQRFVSIFLIGVDLLLINSGHPLLPQ
jgi:hypothetical protein